MNNKISFLFLASIMLLLSINFISAQLCRGGDGYWHDCSYSKDYYTTYGQGRTEYYKDVIENIIFTESKI